MSEIDLDRLGDVWRQQPDPAEMEKLRRTAAGASRRARWAQLIDIGAAVAVAGVVIFFAASDPGVDTFVVSAALILVLLWSQRRQRRLRAIELKSLTGSSEEMLDQSIAQTHATLKRIWFQLVLTPPGLAFGLLIAQVADRDSTTRLMERVIGALGSGQTIVLFALVCLAALAAYSLRTIRTQKHELGRLVALREAYRSEGEANIGDLPPDGSV